MGQQDLFASSAVFLLYCMSLDLAHHLCHNPKPSSCCSHWKEVNLLVRDWWYAGWPVDYVQLLVASVPLSPPAEHRWNTRDVPGLTTQCCANSALALLCRWTTWAWLCSKLTVIIVFNCRNATAYNWAYILPPYWIISPYTFCMMSDG